MRTLLLSLCLCSGRVRGSEARLKCCSQGSETCSSTRKAPRVTTSHNIRSNYYLVPPVTDGSIGQWYLQPASDYQYPNRMWGRYDNSGWNQNQMYIVPPEAWRFDRR